MKLIFLITLIFTDKLLHFPKILTAQFIAITIELPFSRRLIYNQLSQTLKRQSTGSSSVFSATCHSDSNTFFRNQLHIIVSLVS